MSDVQASFVLVEPSMHARKTVVGLLSANLTMGNSTWFEISSKTNNHKIFQYFIVTYRLVLSAVAKVVGFTQACTQMSADTSTGWPIGCKRKLYNLTTISKQDFIDQAGYKLEDIFNLL
jgi:hypothetical protein